MMAEVCNKQETGTIARSPQEKTGCIDWASRIQLYESRASITAPTKATKSKTPTASKGIT